MEFFSGIDPTPKNTWTCKSEKCLMLTSTNASLLQEFPCKITNEEGGKENLILGPADIEWNLDHSSFSVDFDLYCDIGSRQARKTLLSSIYFAGSLTGLILGGYLFDNIGRKRSAIIGTAIAATSLFVGTFCHNYSLLLALRYFLGVGRLLTSTAMFILTMELVPAKQRNIISGWAAALWALGYPVAAGVGYFITSWNYMFLAACIVHLLTTIQVFFCIESPKFYLINNNVTSAKQAFKALAKMTKMDLDLEDTEILDVGKVKDRQQSTKQQLIDLVRHPSLRLETIILMLLWLCVTMFYYGFNFGWGKIVPDIYLGYIMAAVGELIACVLVVPLIAWLGRRRAMMIMFMGAALSYLIAIPEVELGSGWTLESVSCLVGVIFVTGNFTGVYLWTGEIAPTSHVGLVYCLSSGTARIGSFIGPYIFNNLAPVTHKAVPLGGLAVIALLCTLGSFLLVETGDKTIALTGQDIEERRKNYSYHV